MPETVRIAPSILAADPLRLYEGARLAVDAGADELHVDIMDGHFVPNLTYGPAVVKALRRDFPDLWLDVHLMITDPGRYLRTFADAGASGLTVHVEASQDPGIMKSILALGVKPGVSLKPVTPVSELTGWLPLAERVLIMTVEPGFGGQELMPSCAEKAAQLRRMGYRGRIACDGGVTAENAPKLAALGADTLIMGTTFFRARDPEALVRMVHTL